MGNSNDSRTLLRLSILILVAVTFCLKNVSCGGSHDKKGHGGLKILGGHNKNILGGLINRLKLPSMKCPEKLGTGYKCGWEINKALAGEKKKGRKWPHVIFDCQAKTHIAKRVSVCNRMSCTIDDKDKTLRVCSPPKKPSNSLTLSLSSKSSSLVALNVFDA
jgi:hypothetical protein